MFRKIRAKLYGDELNASTLKIGILLIFLAFAAFIPEVIASFKPLFMMDQNHLHDLSTTSFTSLIVLGLFSGTVISFAKFENVDSRYGFTANERILYFNTRKIPFVGFKVNLLEILLLNYLLIPIGLFSLIFNFNNAVLMVFVISIFLTLLEHYMAIDILANKKDSIDNNCRQRIMSEIAKGNFETVEKMFDEFSSKISDGFIFEDEYEFFVITLSDMEETDGFSAYYIKAQSLISKMIYEKRLSIGRTQKLVQDLIYRPKFTTGGTVVMYIDDAVLWAAKNTVYETESLFYILEICYEKFSKEGILERFSLGELMSKFNILFLNLEQNKLMNQADYYSNIKKMEELAVNMATLSNPACVFQPIDANNYGDMKEEIISYHQIPLFYLIKHYVETCNERITVFFRFLNRESHSFNPIIEINDTKLKHLLQLKLSFYFFSLCKNTETPEKEKGFVKKIISRKVNNISFVDSIKRIQSGKKIDIRKDTEYDYFFPVPMDTKYMEDIKFLICLSILLGFDLNFEKLINYEIDAVREIFNDKGELLPSCCCYMNEIATFYGIKYSKIRSKNVYASIPLESDYINPEFEFFKKEDKLLHEAFHDKGEYV